MKPASWLKLLKDSNHAVGTQPTSGADGVKIAVLRKDLAGLGFILAAAHRLESSMHTKIGKRIGVNLSDRIVVAEIASFKEIQHLIILTFLLIMFMIVGPYFTLFRVYKGFSEVPLFFRIFLAFWYIGASQFLLEWLWSMFGKEIITISSDSLKHRRTIFGFGLARAFDKEEVQDIRASGYFEPEKPIKKYSKKFGLKLGAIAIDYRACA
ncbi:hypothetical protein D1AOALGA4SA_96 [Olavius algarvensis Delta 1 endosymbiont]|nr:hypothetical protein D1AOALGA4SA_96 [Olavius algarvensis Delta 1 endosymbiont]